MTSTDLRGLKQAMEAKLTEATQSPSWRDSITIEPSADPLDSTQQTLEREMATRKLDRDAILIRDIRAALARMAHGTYGICLDCEEPISAKRLAAVPWAALCIHCQEKADGDQDYNDDRAADYRIATAA
jgi:DnaK suppressor protein